MGYCKKGLGQKIIRVALFFFLAYVLKEFMLQPCLIKQPPCCLYPNMIQRRKIHLSVHNFACLQTSALENHVSSTTTSGASGLPLYATAATDDVTTTLLTGVLTQELKTLSVPFTVGLINSA